MIKTIFVRKEWGFAMIYTFQDSTVLPVQRDFIQDIQDFIAISKEVIPLERSAIEIKRTNKQEVSLYEKRIQQVEEFERDIRDYLESRTIGIKAEDVLEIKARTLEASSNIALAKKNEKLEELDQQNKLDLTELQQLEARILTILSPFFEKSIYGAKHAYSAWLENKKLRGKQVSFIDRIGYEFELYFTQDSLKVKDLQTHPEPITLPVWSKSGILSREEKLKRIDISDFYIANLESEGNNLTTLLEDKDAEHKFTISTNENTFLILHNDYEITGDQELFSALDKNSIEAFILKLKEFFTETGISKELRRIVFDGRNAFGENKIFDCLKLIASIYGPLVMQCIERGYTEGEITIKIEVPEGIRTEKYLEKSEVVRELSTLGSEGIELARILRVTEV